MARALWKGAVLAESDEVIILEGNVYFPSHSVRFEYLQPSDKTSVCGWKGTARYYHVVVNGEINMNAAWCYEDPKPAAKNIKNYIAFWNGVQVLPD